ncbi:hypothetical protein [Salinispira pacifica]|uniref:Gliding motility protein SprA N-terminal domain-containing protein n=1 Tax=Salinispira pacifica TaxID=1307761 RepID=V5WGV2_9SPIO|nr:hypothetical protein [Salinispira pacifica]AHC15037.1 hypothetical protein L21SP2_1652 [Salinispira pacifica]
MQVSVLLLVFLLYSNGIAAQNANTTLPSLGADGSLIYPEEAPRALFEYDIDDTSVEFFLLGSWEAKLGFAAGMGWIPDGSGGYTTQSILPGSLISTPLTNTVDLVLSLWIEQKYFFESSFRSGFRDNSILAGYYGEGRLRELKLGNTDIGISEYPMLGLGAGPQGSPGISAVFADLFGSNSKAVEGSLHELMFRYETSTLVERSFQGNREFIQEDKAIHEAVSSSLFLLPHSNVEDLTVLIQADADEAGPYLDDQRGERYRRLTAGTDYGLRDDIPLLSLNPSLLNDGSPGESKRLPRVLVRYRGNGVYPEEGSFAGDIAVSRLYPGDPGVGREEVQFSLQPGADFDQFVVASLDALSGGSALSNLELEDFTVTLNGDSYLLLHDPRLFSPFAVRSRYAASSTPSTVQLIGPDSRSRSVPFQPIQGDSEADVEILPSGSPEALADPWRIRYPLLTLSDDYDFLEAVGSAYGPLSPESSALPDRQARSIRGYRLRFLSEQGEGLRIDQEIIPGSLQVYRNGILEQSAYLDQGKVVLPEDIASNDSIQLRYRISDPSGNNGSISFAAGQKIFLPGEQLWTLSAGGSVVVRSQTEGTGQTADDEPPTDGGASESGTGEDEDGEIGEPTESAESAEFYSNLPGTPGYLQIGSSYSYRDEFLELSVNAAMGIYSGGSGDPLFSPGDTDARMDLSLSPLTLVPSAPPYSNQLQNLDVPQLPGLSGTEFTHETRGRLYFRNYRSSLRGILLTREQAESEGTPDRVGGVSGPYPVLASAADTDSAGVEGVVSVLEFEVDADSWVGYQARGGSSGVMQIPSGFALEVLPASLESVPGDLHVFLQLGAISEDSDEDRILDVQPDPNSRGYEFNGWEEDLTAGYPGQAYSSSYRGTGEDLNSNGLLDAQLPSAMTSIYLGSIAAEDEGSWKTLKGDFTTEQRNVLLNHPELRENLRVIVYSPQSGQGVLQFGGHRYTHIPVLVNGSLRPVNQDAADPGESAPQPSRNIQYFQYTSATQADITFPLGGIPRGLYSQLILPVFLRSASQLPDFHISVNSMDAGTLSIPAGEIWYRIVMDLDDAALLLLDREGEILSQTDIPSTLENSGPLNSLTLRFNPQGSGELYVQKPYFSGLDNLPGGGIQASVNLNPGLSTHSSPWLAFALDRVEFRGNAYSPSFPDGNGADGSMRLLGRIPGLETELHTAVSVPDYRRGTADLEIGHRAEFDPIQVFAIANSFSRNFTPGDPDPDGNRRRISHDLSLSLNPLDFFGSSAGYSFALSALSMNRSWNLSGKLTPGEILDLTGEMGLEIAEDDSNRAAAFYEDGPQSYGHQYTRSLGQIDWNEIPGEFFRRSLHLEGSGTADGEGLDLALNGWYTSGVNVAGDTRFSANLQQEQKISFSGPKDTSLELAQKSGTSLITSQSAETLEAQLDLSFRQLGDAPLMWLPLGIAGILDPGLEQKFADQFLHPPSFQPIRSSALDYLFETEFRRVPDSGISGLLIPAGADFSLSRNISWQDGIIRDARFLTAGIDWQAINLFGRQGRNALFSFFDSDDYFYGIETGLNMNQPEIWYGSFSSQSILYFPDTLDELELEGSAKYWNRGRIASRISLGVSLSWVSELNPWDSLTEFLQRHASREEPGGLSIRHREGVEVGFSSLSPRSFPIPGERQLPPGWLQPGIPGSEIIISHSSSLRFSSIGSMTIEIKGAYETEALEEINYQKSHKIGMQIDAILELSY